VSKISPFDYVSSINLKQYRHDLSGYNPFLTNRAFAYHLDTIMLADEMNQAHALAPHLQYDFYYYAVRKGKRFGFPLKVQESDEDLALVMEHYNYSREKALVALTLLSPEQLNAIRVSKDKGGNSK